MSIKVKLEKPKQTISTYKKFTHGVFGKVYRVAVLFMYIVPNCFVILQFKLEIGGISLICLNYVQSYLLRTYKPILLVERIRSNKFL